MAAPTSNRKLGNESWNFNGARLSPNSPNFRIAKSPRLSSIQQILDPTCVSSNATVLKLSGFPEETPKLRREIHAPCTTRKFGFPKKSSYLSRPLEIYEKDEFGEVAMGNILSYNYEKAKSRALGALRHLQKYMDVTQLQKESERDGGEIEDSSIQEVEVIEDDGREGGSMVSDQRSREVDRVLANVQELDLKVRDGPKQTSFSVVSDLSAEYKKVESVEKTLNAMSESRDISGVSAYKKLQESVEMRTSRLRSLQFEIELNERRRSMSQQLRQKKVLFEDDPGGPFVPLTKAEEAEVEEAFSVNWRKILVTHEKSNVDITVEILQCLRPGAWLNDEVINLYLDLLKERENREPRTYLQCHFFNTFFFKTLIRGPSGYDYKAVRRWTSQKMLGYELAECDKIFVPIHKEIHWCLAVINKKDKKFQYLDSLGGKDAIVLKLLARYFKDEVKDKSGKDIDVSLWEHEYVEDLPLQENGFDCGMFIIKYADFYSRGLGLCFNQGHMPYFRLRTAKEILKLRVD